MRSSLLLCFALLGAAALLEGCASSSSSSRWSRHFDGATWSGAFAQQSSNPVSMAPEIALLATIPASFVFDDQIQQHYETQSIDPALQDASTVLQVVLPAIPVTIGIIDWAQGDDGKQFEVVAESLASVVLVQQALARTVSRERPNEKDSTSFPSGHTSWAFAASTLIVRETHAPGDNSFHALDALIYAPAIFCAWERVADNRHWASDVTCGALLGVVLTNWIWDAHYGNGDEGRETIYESHGSRGIAWRPTFEMIDGQFALGLSGGF
jgi:hypothetical protein